MRRSGCAAFAAIVGGALVGAPQPAAACSCVPPPTVTPPDGATGVPRNAVLVVVSEGEAIGLVRDGEPVPFEVIESTPSRFAVVSLVRPGALLESGATYEVRVGDLSSSFTTGLGIDDQPPEFAGLERMSSTRYRVLSGCGNSCWSLEDGTDEILLEHDAVPDDVAFARYRVREKGSAAILFERLVPREPWDQLMRMTSDLCNPAESPPLEAGVTYCVQLTLFDQAGNPAGGDRDVCATTETCEMRECPDDVSAAVCDGGEEPPARDREGGCSAAPTGGPVALALIVLLAFFAQRGRVSARMRR